MSSIPSVGPKYYPETQSTSNDTGTNSTSSKPGGEMGKDEFLKLLVAQMSNQDPLNPMDGKEMAAQLAQFSSVEQLININTKLDDLTAQLKAAQATTQETQPAA